MFSRKTASWSSHHSKESMHSSDLGVLHFEFRLICKSHIKTNITEVTEVRMCVTQ